MKVILLRHGLTRGNLEKRYIGSTDEPLCPEGMEQLDALGQSQWRGPVYASPMLRAFRTAQCLFPCARIISVPGLKEMDFGVFEGRNYHDMEDFVPYRQWVDGMCEGKCPGGESRAEFIGRIAAAFSEALERHAGQPADMPMVIVAHGGTVMALMSRYASPPGEYWQWRCPPAGGYTAEWDGTTLKGYRPVSGEEAVSASRDFPCLP